MKRAPERESSLNIVSAEAREIDEKLAEARVTLNTQRWDASAALIHRATELATKLGDHALKARTMLALCSLQEAKLDPEAKDTLLKAALALEETHQDVLCARAWLLLVAVRQNSVEELDRFALHTKAAVARVGDDPVLQLELHRALERIAAHAARWEVAIDEASQSGALATAIYGTTHPWVGDAFVRMASAENFTTQFDAARVHLAKAEAIYQSNFGADHPRAAGLLRIRGMIEKSTGNYAESVAVFQRLLAIEQQTIGADSSFYFVRFAAARLRASRRWAGRRSAKHGLAFACDTPGPLRR